MSKEAMKRAVDKIKSTFWEGYVPEPDKRQQALDKKAENARELGLDYEPAQQEPFGYFRYDLRLDAWVQNRAGLTGTPFYTSPPAQRTWVGLSDAQSTVIWANSQSVDEAIRATEKQLMENNK